MHSPDTSPRGPLPPSNQLAPLLPGVVTSRLGSILRDYRIGWRATKMVWTWPSLVLLTVAMIVGGVVWRLASASEPGEKTDITQIRASDIPGRVRIVGELGQALCTIVDLQGEWQAPKPLVKWPRLHLRVIHVNGEALELPVEFPVELVKPAVEGEMKLDPVAGEVWHMRAFESGGMVGFPDEVWNALAVPTPAEAYGHGFLTRLYLISHAVMKSDR
jgi:hypothetical protein